MNKNLPKDVFQYARKKIIRCITLFALLEGVAIGIGILSWDYFFTRTPLPFHIGMLLLICAAPFYFSGFPWKLIDRSWCGTVTDISIEQEQGVCHTSAGHGHPYIKNVIYLKVKKDNGKEVYLAAKEFGIRHYKGFPVPNEGDVTKHLEDYSVGDRVYHFYGLKYNYIVKKNSDMVECVVCGSQNHKERNDCLNCGHSLIKLS